MTEYKQLVPDRFGFELVRGTWRCQNPKCRQEYAEYANGCPRCATSEVGGSHAVKLEIEKDKT